MLLKKKKSVMVTSTVRLIQITSFSTVVFLILQGSLLQRLSGPIRPDDSFDLPNKVESRQMEKKSAQVDREDNRKVKEGDGGPIQSDDLRDKNCPFKDSPIYQSIYVYPSPQEEAWKGDILSEYGKTHNITWPWIAIEERTRKEGIAHFDNKHKDFNQYTTELLVKEIITNPGSCLRTYNPDTASLFYTPWLPSVEYHNGKLYGDYKVSPFGRALTDATEGDYGKWESTFGLTSKYWRRRNGSDHILVFSEPCHGLYHPRNKRGNFHFINSQKQLAPPIIISVELSTTFVQMYPNCARKNILMPYPNTDGKWFNGDYDQQTLQLFSKSNFPNVKESKAALPGEQLLHYQTGTSASVHKRARPLSQFYSAGNHGTCKRLRAIMTTNFKCTESGKLAKEHNRYLKHQYGYRQSSFCPCPGGDTPSAKRMFDALHAGCIPIILSEDFVWPFTREFDNISSPFLEPHDFSIRLDAKLYEKEKYDNKCKLKNGTSPSTHDLQSFIETISSKNILRLREAAWKASERYSYYKSRPDLPENPLRERLLPDGGAAHALVQMLSERANGKVWPACENDLSKLEKKPDKVMHFKC